MILITIFLLLAPGLLAIKVAGRKDVKTWQDTVNAFAACMLNNLLIIVFTNALMYLTKGNIQINFTDVYMEQNIYNSIYFNTFIVRYGIFAIAGAVILGLAERYMVKYLKKKGYIDKE